MRFRPRTLRRLGIFLLICALGAATIWAYRGHVVDEREQSLRRERQRGLIAYAMGEMPAAISSLSLYLGESRAAQTHEDFDASFALASARAQVPLPGDRHLEQSEMLVRRLLNDLPRHPRRLEARQLLMYLLAQRGNWATLRHASESTLADFPDDAVSLRMRRISFERTGELRAAIESALRLNELDPDNPDDQIQTLRLLRSNGADPQALIQRAIELRERNSGDPGMLLVLAIAYQNANQLNQAIATVQEATRRLEQSPEPLTLARRLVGLCDALEEWEQGDAVLVNGLSSPGIEPGPRARLEALAAIRLWQIDQADRALELLDAHASGDPDDRIFTLIAVAMIAPEASERRQQAVEALRLAAREGSADPELRRMALAVVETLEATELAGPSLLADADQAVTERIEVLETALLRVNAGIGFGPMFADDPVAAFVQQAIGDAWHALGETSLAVQHWRLAADASSGWIAPYLSIGEGLRSASQLEEAAEAAREAGRRQRGGLGDPAGALLARIAFDRYLASPSNAEADRATLLVSDYLRRHPDDDALLAANIRLVAIRDREAAQALLEQALARELSPAIRLDIARTAHAAQLSIDPEDMPRADTPEAALFHAERLAAQERSREAKALLAKLAQSLRNRPDALPAQRVAAELAMARFLEAHRPAEAPDAWVQLGSAWPDNAQVQRAILNEGESIRHDRELVSRTIERLRTATGETGRQWRLARARWLLADSEPASAMEAAAMLRVLIRGGSGNETIDARLLLAEGLDAGGNTETAVEHLLAAFEMDPTRGDVGLRLVALLEELGRIDQAGRILGRLAAEGVTGIDERLEVADRLAAGGNLPAAISLLRQAELAGNLDQRSRLVLVDLLGQADRADEAAELFAQLLASESAGPDVLLAAAVFFHQQGDIERAAEVRSRLSQSDLSATEKLIVEGTIFARTGRPDEAAEAFDAALARNPTNASPYREAAAFELSRGNTPRSRDYALRGLALHPADEELLLLSAVATVEGMRSPDHTDSRRLAAFASGISGRGAATLRPNEIALLQRLSRLPVDHWLPGDLAQADVMGVKLPLFGSLQRLLVDAYAARAELADAAAVAGRWAEAARYDAAAQRTAYFLTRQTNDLADAEVYARRWRALSAGEDDPSAVMADAALADALLLRGEVEKALALLEPRLPAARKNPEENRPLLLIAARGLARADRANEAFGLISGSLGDPDWRSQALNLAVEAIDDPIEASSWIHAIAAQVPAEAPVEERLTVVEAWIGLARRLHHPEATDQATQSLAALLEGPASGLPRAWRLAVMLARVKGDPEATELALRRILAIEPRDAAAANDLAFLLLTHDLKRADGGGDFPDSDAEREEEAVVDEALGWAEVAVRTVPDNPIYQDTLARAYRWAGDVTAARETFGRALRLDGEYLDAMLGLADLHLSTGDRAQAERLFERLEPLYRAASEVHPHLKEEFARLARAFAVERV